jgi:hypothetical protein
MYSFTGKMNIERGVAIWFLAYQVQRQQEENVFQMLSTTCLKRHFKKKMGLEWMPTRFTS